MTRFADQKYIDDYWNTGRYPQIHDDIFTIVNARSERVPTVDLGSCIGLLTKRLSEIMPFVVGVEGNRSYVKRAVDNRNIEFVNSYVTEDTLKALLEGMEKRGIKTLVARRVLPEIADTGGVALVHDLAKGLHAIGVEQIFIEGRKATKNAKNPLSDVRKEMAALSPYYKPVSKYKNCVELIRNEAI